MAAILTPGLKPGDILAPVKSAFGWHVIQVMYRPTDDDLAEGRSRPRPTAAPTSPTLARDNSEAETAGRGGDLGWVAKGQLADAAARRRSSRRRSARPATSSTSPATACTCSRSSSEETRTPEGDAARRAQGRRLLELVRRRRRAPAPDPATILTDFAPDSAKRRDRVLDALVAEARLRWGLDPAPGVQVVAAERLIATPIEPSRPLLIVPLACCVRRGGRGGARRPRPSGRCRADTGRRAAAGRGAAAGSTRRTTRSAGSGRRRARRSGR